MLDEVHARYLEFRSLLSSELSCTKNAGKPWIRQSFFRQCFKITISPKFLPPKFLTIWYIAFQRFLENVEPQI